MSGVLGHRGLLLDGGMPVFVPELLMHFEGANGGTSFTDSGPNGYTITSGSSAQTLTNQFKFGASSLFPSASGSWVQAGPTNPPSSLRLSSGDFILDFWIRMQTPSGNKAVFRTGGGHQNTAPCPWSIFADASGVLRFRAFNSAGSSLLVSQDIGAPALNTWVHILVSRSGSTLYMFMDGVTVYSGAAGDFWAGDASTRWTFGDPSGWYSTAACHIDELRVVVGHAVTADFAVPTAPY